MKKLIMLQGLPGSGKSTWAREQVVKGAGKVGLVNKDSIRAESTLTGWVWSRENEKDVLRIRDMYIVDLLARGIDVISDDCNFGRAHRIRLEQLARQAGATFEIKRFDVPVEECIRRVEERAARGIQPSVDRSVVLKMAETYRIDVPDDYSTIAKYVPPESSMKAIICDLDGTLSLFKDKGHRGPYDATRCDEDDVNFVVRNLLEVYYRFMQDQIVYLSGREATYREPTLKFLRNNGCPPGPLYMRPAGDTRKDWIVKAELFDANVRHKYHARFVLDDRDQVVKMWRSIGLTCLQVADGNF